MYAMTLLSLGEWLRERIAFPLGFQDKNLHPLGDLHYEISKSRDFHEEG